MKALRRWIVWLLLWHLLIVLTYFKWDAGKQMPTWMGMLIVFSLPTVQFTWSFTVGVILGPYRRRRRLYWSVFLLSFIPLSLVRALCWLAYYFYGLRAALTCLAICLGVLFLETFAGLLYGSLLHNYYTKS
jgi:hypothetical protein